MVGRPVAAERVLSHICDQLVRVDGGAERDERSGGLGAVGGGGGVGSDRGGGLIGVV